MQQNRAGRYNNLKKSLTAALTCRGHRFPCGAADVVNQSPSWSAGRFARSELLSVVASTRMSLLFPAHPTSRPRRRHRRGHLIPILAGLSLALPAVAVVAYLLWPT